MCYKPISIFQTAEAICRNLLEEVFIASFNGESGTQSPRADADDRSSDAGRSSSPEVRVRMIQIVAFIQHLFNIYKCIKSVPKKGSVSHERSRGPQDGPRGRPRSLQDRPSDPQERPRDSPRPTTGQEFAKTAPDATKMHPKAERGLPVQDLRDTRGLPEVPLRITFQARPSKYYVNRFERFS